MQRLYIFILTCLLAFPISAQDTLVIQNLRHMWVEVDSKGNLTPYTSGNSPELIFFELSTSEQQDYLLLKSKKKVDVWLNNELILLQFDSAVTLDLDSLFKEKGDNLRFKLFSAGGIDQSLVTKKIRIGNFTETDLITLKERQKSEANDLYLITLSIILLLTGIFRRYFPLVFYQSIRNPLSRTASTKRTYDSFASADNLYSIFFFGAISTLFFAYLGYNVVLFSGSGVIHGLFNWLISTFVVVGVIVLKYLWTKFISLLYQYRETPNIQTQDFIRFFTLIMLLGTLFTLIDFSLFGSGSGWFRDMTLYIVLLALVFFQIWLFRKFDKHYSHKKLMIISYLCTTEFLPGFLAVYWLVKM